MNYLYIISCGNDKYKVGVSNNVRKRLATLQTSNSNKLRIVMTKAFEDAFPIEKMLHKSLDEYKLDGGHEWFDIPPEKLIGIMMTISDYPEYPVQSLGELGKRIDHAIDILNRKQEKAIHDAEKRSEARRDNPVDDSIAYLAAVEHIHKTGKASTSALQRTMKLGYSRAARIMDRMEDEGLVGPLNGAVPRAIYHDKIKLMYLENV